ncbi:hypothetical protein B0H17DRAFT_1123917 [Mycena rosella]|uniref:F-box domain-containing protein n=1 Tax=Mycena rosella TaxID=1033263 RepID=A0AAD7H3A7_MYCRO|nr:hypothetical protein B0H17DRAFT_1123917 [Mycena rosella]
MDVQRAIDRVPPEIMHEILAQTVVAVSPQAAHADVPWYLGQISTSWRRAALNTGVLWAGIGVDERRYCPKAMEERLKRSGYVLLNVIFAYGHNARDRDVLEMLVREAARWEAATLELTPGDFNAVAGVRGKLGRLHYLSLTVGDFEEYTQTANQTNPFEICPQLRDLVIGGLEGLRHPLVLPFEQLEHLHAPWDATLPDLVLGRTPNLHSVSLVWTLQYPRLGAATTPLRLPLLQRLEIEHRQCPLNSNSLDLLDRVNLPQLVYLSVTRPASADPFVRLVARGGVRALRTLRIVGVTRETPETLRGVLNAAPTTSRLELCFTPYSRRGDGVLAGLTVCADVEDTTGPNVESLLLELQRGTFDETAAVNMIESRFRTGATRTCVRLKDVKVVANTLKTRSQKILKKLENEGLKVGLDVKIA